MKVKDIEYSVIVPVYNVEKVLRRCIESILNQTFSNFELILVDDGSTDKSGEICDEYKKKDERVKVIHQKNQGVSKARNVGLDLAAGKYVVFVDSDDYVSVEYLFHLGQTDSDLVICGYTLIDERICVLKEEKYQPQYFLKNNGKEIRDNFQNGRFNYVFAKRYKKEILIESGLRFDERISLAEDTLFVVEYIKVIKDIQLLNYVDYFYVNHENETLSNRPMSKGLINDLEWVNFRIYDGIKNVLCGQAEQSVSIRIGKLYRNYIAMFIREEYSPELVKYLFKQYWFRKSLKYVDVVYYDEDVKFRMLLKLKSASAFLVYIKLFCKKR